MRVVGMISGTSYDAVEIAVADLTVEDGTLVLHPVGAHSADFPPSLRAAIAAVLPPNPTTIQDVCRLDTKLGQHFGRAAREIIDAHGGGCDLVCSHGQTVYHWVDDGRARGTLQLGQPAWIAQACGAPVISDLRSADIAVGGQGAPLVAVLDDLLVLGDDEVRRGSLNLGGIANITLRRDGRVLAWDLGPANALIDAAVVRLTGGTQTLDTDGARGARGTVRADLLERLLAEPYYARPAPKSTGKELFDAGYVDAFAAGLSVDGDDLVATLTELTTELVARACREDGLDELVVAGGGAHNPTLMARLAQRCAPTRLRPIEDFGLGTGSKEAYAFAVLGWLSAHGLPGALPSVTGANTAAVLGSVTPAPRVSATGSSALRPWTLPDPPPAMPRRLVVRP